VFLDAGTGLMINSGQTEIQGKINILKKFWFFGLNQLSSRRPEMG
jgi:hypothetical protein